MDRTFDLGGVTCCKIIQFQGDASRYGPSLFRIAAEILRYDFADF